MEGAEAAVDMTVERTDEGIRVHKTGFPAVVYRVDGSESSSTHMPPIPAYSIVTRRFRSKWVERRFVVTIAQETNVLGSEDYECEQETMYLEGPDRRE